MKDYKKYRIALRMFPRYEKLEDILKKVFAVIENDDFDTKSFNPFDTSGFCFLDFENTTYEVLKWKVPNVYTLLEYDKLGGRDMGTVTDEEVILRIDVVEE